MEKEEWFVFLFTIVFICLVGGAGMIWESYVCHSKYRDYNPSWGILSGCQAEWMGKMTPVENIRLI